MGEHVVPAGPLEALGVHGLLFLLGTSFGTFAAVVSHDRPRLRSLIRISMLPLYILSGVIFPIHVAPPDTRELLLFNPLLHLIELSRHAFIPEYPVLDGVNLIYPLLFVLALCTAALGLYRIERLRLVTST
jgi:capsular polysaccharide transport system permease protein